MDRTKLMHLLKEDEGFKLDYKFKLSLEIDSEKKEFVKDVIAIANTEGGRGYIVFGVEDKTKRIVGIENVPVDIEERIQQILTYRSVPPVPVSFNLIEIKQKQVGVLTIYRSKQVPHQMRQNGAFYIRRGSTTDMATRHEIAQMLQERGIVTYELVPCRQATLEDLDLEKIEKHFNYFKGSETQKIQMLKILGIISDEEDARKQCPTYGGLLLFGKMPQNFIPQSLVEVECEGKLIGMKGHIMAMIKQFKEEVIAALPPDYPKMVLEEVFANALIHRDYWNPSYYIKVEIREDYIRVINPSPYQYENQTYLKARINPWLYSRLLLLEQKDEQLHFGIGLEKASEILEKRVHKTLKVTAKDGFFCVELPGTCLGIEEE